MGFTENPFFGRRPMTREEMDEARRQLDKLQLGRAGSVRNTKLWTGPPAVDPTTGRPMPAAILWASVQQTISQDEDYDVKRAVPGGYTGHGGWISTEVTDAGGVRLRRQYRLGSEYPLILGLGIYTSVTVKIQKILNSAAPLNFLWLNGAAAPGAQQDAYPAPIWVNSGGTLNNVDHFTPDGALRVKSNTAVTITWTDYSTGTALTEAVAMTAGTEYKVDGGIFAVSASCQLTFYIAAL